jgi:hypothetical protein
MSASKAIGDLLWQRVRDNAFHPWARSEWRIGFS